MITIPPTDDYGSVTLIGTVHISEQSRDRIQHTIQTHEPDAVAIELDPDRFERLWNNTESQLTGLLSQLVSDTSAKQKLLYMLYAVQQHRQLSDVSLDIGEADFLPAARTARAIDADLHLIDADSDDAFSDVADTLTKSGIRDHFNTQFTDVRDIVDFLHNYAYTQRYFADNGVTISVDSDASLAQKLWTILTDVDTHAAIDAFENASISETETIAETYKTMMPPLHSLIDSRDRYMAGRLDWLRRHHDTVIAVVGKAHVPGIRDYLQDTSQLDDDHITSSPSVTFRESETDETTTPLDTTPAPQQPQLDINSILKLFR